MEAGAMDSVDKLIWAGSLMEAMAVETFLFAANNLSRLLTVIGSMPQMNATEESFPFDELRQVKQRAPENKDGGEADEDDDDDDDEDDDANDEDDDGDDEDFSGEEVGEEGNPEGNLEANGEEGSGEEDNEEDDDDDDDDEDDDEEDEDEEDEENEEVPQPPSKKRK